MLSSAFPGFFTWFKGQNKKRWSSGFVGPFAVRIGPDGITYELLVNTEEGMFCIPLQKIHHLTGDQDADNPTK